MPPFDRSRLDFRPLAERRSKTTTASLVSPGAPPPPLEAAEEREIGAIAQAVRAARGRGSPVLLAYGAHLFKNGLSPVVVRLLENGRLTQIATNGGGAIHDFEMAFQGATEEDVGGYLREGRFGIWEETGRWIALAVLAGAAQGRGFGESVGRMIASGAIDVPDAAEARRRLRAGLAEKKAEEGLGGWADLLDAVERDPAAAGRHKVPCPHAATSILGTAARLGVPAAVCPGIGYDIYFAHPLAHGGAVGRAALHDFLVFASAISRLQGGVYLSVGSAVMSPMILEKALSMARNVARQEGRTIEDFDLVVVDIQPSGWDWSRGEPPKESPAYYLRFCKSFSRMGGRFRYLEMDNRRFLANLAARL